MFDVAKGVTERLQVNEVSIGVGSVVTPVVAVGRVFVGGEGKGEVDDLGSGVGGGVEEVEDIAAAAIGASLDRGLEEVGGEVVGAEAVEEVGVPSCGLGQERCRALRGRLAGEVGA